MPGSKKNTISKSKAPHSPEIVASRKAKATAVLVALKKRYPVLEKHLQASNAWELLVATMLSAQCTDARVNQVTPALFSRWPTPAALALAAPAELEACIHSTGFYRNKAANLLATATRLCADFGGQVPNTMEKLITLPGIARKSANVILWGAYGKNEGIAIDTHVARIAFRLGLSSSHDPICIEKELLPLFPQKEWGGVNHRMVWFGRHVCNARKPLCPTCELQQICERNGLC